MNPIKVAIIVGKMDSGGKKNLIMEYYRHIDGKYEIEDQVNFTVYVPKVDEHFIGSLAVIPLQLLGYYVSVAKGLDVDKPRNLAKSVTVE